VYSTTERKMLGRASISIILMLLSFLWLREISLRVARTEACDFIGPLISEVPCHYEYFSFSGFSTSKGRKFMPGWVVNFLPYGVEMDPCVEIYVSVCGNIIASNVPELDALIGASSEARKKRVNSYIEQQRVGRPGSARGSGIDSASLFRLGN
jgi:hypothetical protein